MAQGAPWRVSLSSQPQLCNQPQPPCTLAMYCIRFCYMFYQQWQTYEWILLLSSVKRYCYSRPSSKLHCDNDSEASYLWNCILRSHHLAGAYSSLFAIHTLVVLITMVRYFPHSYVAVHPLYPHALNCGPANMVLATVPPSGFFGLGIGTTRYLLNYLIGRQTLGLYMRSAAICTVGLATPNFYCNITRNRQLNSLGFIPDRRKVYLTNLRKVDVDDWCLIGGLLGIALALRPVRSPSVTGWKRYLGASSIGSSGGMFAYHIRYKDQVHRSCDLQKAFIAEARARSQRADGGGFTKDPDREH